MGSRNDFLKGRKKKFLEGRLGPRTEACGIRPGQNQWTKRSHCKVGEGREKEVITYEYDISVYEEKVIASSDHSLCAIDLAKD